MKYSENNKPLVCMMTESRCYTRTYKMKPLGVLWHSTGANNPALKRYIQPSKNDNNYNKLVSLIGKNNNGNDWNDPDLKAGLNGWIGKMANGSVSTIQVMPWDYRPWGCASGPKGSCNDNWIQFEICEDNLSNKKYFNEVYREACELTAYLCKEYNLDPMGSVNYNGVKVPVILCHADSYDLGLGSNHSDVMHWFKKHGKTMNDVRRDVANLMNGQQESSLLKQENETVNTLVEKGIISTPEHWENNWDKLKYLDVLLKEIVKVAKSEKVKNFKNIEEAINHLYQCKIIGSPNYWLSNYSKIKYLDILLISAANHISDDFSPFLVRVEVPQLNYRKGPSLEEAIVGVVKQGQVFTIVEKKDEWGKLKSGAGWIHLGYTKPV